MKTADILRTAVTNTFRSKLRTFLTVLAIFVGAFTLTITSAIGVGVAQYISKQVASVGATNMLQVTKTASTAVGSGPVKYDSRTATGSTQGSQRGPDSGAVLTASDISTIRGIKGVNSVTPSATVAADYIQRGAGTRYVPTIDDSTGVTSADLAAGAQLDQGLSAPAQVLIPTTYVEPLGFSSDGSALGTTVTLATTDYTGAQHLRRATIVGVQNGTLFSTGVALNTTLTRELASDAQRGRPNAVKTSYRSATVTFPTGATTEQVVALKGRLAHAGFTGETTADQLGSFQTVINAIVGILDAFAVIALLAAGFGIVNTLLMSVQERTREIGLMKAMGMGGGRIYALFSTEALFIGFLGSVMGVALATGVGSIASTALSRGALASLPGLHILVFTPSSIAAIVLVVMAIAFLAGTLPARRAARQDPIEALRYE